MSRFFEDVRYALRNFAGNRIFVVAAVVSLVLGIGVNTSIFSIINAVILRSLPVEDPHRLVEISIGGAGGSDAITNPIWEQIRDNPQAFSGTLAYAVARFDLADGGESHFAQGMWVSGDFFHVLGVPALKGRVLTPGDDQHGGGSSGPVAVISYQFWKRNFAGKPDTIGQIVSLNRHKFEIVGVTPPWFTGLDVDHGFDVAIPIGCEPILRAGRSQLADRSASWLQLVGRLAPGQSLRQAEERLKTAAPAILEATLPSGWNEQDQKDYLESSFALKPFATGFSEVGTRYRTALWLLMGTAGLVLLIACANIANLLLARAVARQREFSVRMAVGASRRQVVRQLMTESILLSSLGAIGGFLLASLVSKVLVSLLSTWRNPVEIDVSPDLRVFAFTTVAALVTAVAFGLAPALRAVSLELNRALKENAPGAVYGASRFNAAKALVAGQIALSLVVLICAGLFLATLRKLLTVDSGFDRHNVLVVTADVQEAAIPPSRRLRTYHQILDRIRAVPGVLSAASSTITPISGLGWNTFTYPDGYVAKSRWDTLVFLNRVSPGYFPTMRTPLLRGRDFNEHDNLTSAKVMILAESTAHEFFGSENPVGKRISTDVPGKPGERAPYEVVGVVSDTKYRRIDEQPTKTGFLASGQDGEPQPTIRYEVRSEVPIDLLIPSIRSAIAEQNRSIALEFHDFEVLVNQSLVEQRVVALLSSIFGSLALLLAMVGLYGITAYGVNRRQAELGIRIALGAREGNMIWLVLREVVGLLAVGMALGFSVALVAGRVVGSLLFRVTPNDPVELGGAALVLAGATAIAAYLPARRAAKVDPMVALRCE